MTAEAIRLYCGVSDGQWNHHPTAPGAYTCISPVYGSTEKSRRESRPRIPRDTRVIQDSGAFSDGPKSRLSFEAALQRQLLHSDKYGYTDQITHRASYDLLIDEVWTEGNRSKRRWSESAAGEAVDITVNAARYMKSYYDKPAILSAQGVTAQQYFECVKRIVPMLDLEHDILGLGGWCIIGKMPKVMMPVFRDTVDLVIPFAAEFGVKWVHIWGVIYTPALAYLLRACDRAGLFLSTDSAGPALRPCFGEWGYGSFRKPYSRPPESIRGLERARHVAETRNWLANFRDNEYYPAPSVQLPLFEVSA